MMAAPTEVEVLVVEDEAIVAADIKASLQQTGYKVVSSVRSGEEAITAVKQLAPDLVLMDIVLAGPIDGIEVATHIRSNYKIPVVYLTAYADQARLNRAKPTMPYGYIVKPFDDQNLAVALEMALYRHKQDKLLRDQEMILSTALNKIQSMIVVCNEEGQVQYSNWDQESNAERPLNEILKIKLKNGNLEDLIKGAIKQHDVIHQENCLLQVRGGEIQVNLYCSPVEGKAEEPDRVVLVLDEISGHQKSEMDLPSEALELRITNDSLKQFNLFQFQNLIEFINKTEAYSFALLNENLKDLNDSGRNLLLSLIMALTKIKRFISEQIEFSGAVLSGQFFHPIDLKAVVSEVLIDLSLQKKEVKVPVIVGELPIIEASRFMMRMLFYNLISNSLKSYKADLPLLLTVDSRPVDKGFWEIAVEDNGVGLDEKKLERIQKLFKNPKPGKIEDGLWGLSMCHNIVALHKGTITVKNQPEGGTQVFIKLPKKQAIV